MHIAFFRSAWMILLTMMAYYSFSQVTGIKPMIDQALDNKAYSRAESILENHLNQLFETQSLDSLPAYVMYVGQVAAKKYSVDVAIQKVDLFLKKIESVATGAEILSRSYAQAGEYYGSVGMNELAYKTNKKAYDYELQNAGYSKETLASIDSDMGTFAFRMGNISLSQKHHRKAIQVFLTSVKPDYESLYVAGNNIAGIMWMSSKMDSALYYYNIALAALAKTERTPINQYYRPAVLQNNMSALFNMQGKTTQAISMLKSTIDNLKKYLSIREPAPKKSNTIGFQYEATDNLAGIYKELGDYMQAHQLLQYSYRQKLKKEEGDETGIFKSQILLGQLYLAMKEHSKAIDHLTIGLENISKADGDFLFWQADACNSLALLYDEKKNIPLATFYYEKADSLYEESLQGSYDNIYLEFLRNASLFYAENGQFPVAMAKANKGYRYVTIAQGTETLLAFYQLLNLSEINLLSGNYQQALETSKKGIVIVEKIAGHSDNLLDSIKTELKKPKAILLKSKAEYALMPSKNVTQLKQILQELTEALDLIEKRKTIVHDSRDISLLVSDHAGLLNFIKKITLDLHYLTNDKRYIDRLLDLHESGIYNRIRARLDKSDSIKFAHIPADVQLMEKKLKTAIRTSLTSSELHGKSMNEYFKALDNWERFQAMVKKQYPQYYKLRYASIFKSIGDIQKSIPKGSTLIRYFFIDKDLFAFVADNEKTQFIPLRSGDVEASITSLARYGSDIDKSAIALHSLFNQIWLPLASHISHKKIIIIPDGILYKLNFEILTPKKITGFDQLATNSLLAKYTISYHYSLLLVGQKSKSAEVSDNFVAFAPGFLDNEKKRYRSGIKDSLQLDQSYVSLLPQPFTIEFVSKAEDMLGGKAFINSASTAEAFRSNAGRHRIIHIGTHAESNNIMPEFSRLIFSKNESGNQNSIYLHELYNCDLRSELAVLTACESGMPGYQDGEGMISIAHAFNYAGSESILTGLWKIDEKASTILVEKFYGYLMDGLEKDEALRLAKLDYLKQAKGRMLSPQYWAGLVLMGDTSPIKLEKRTNNNLWWIAGLGLLIITISFYLYRRK